MNQRSRESAKRLGVRALLRRFCVRRPSPSASHRAHPDDTDHTGNEPVVFQTNDLTLPTMALASMPYLAISSSGLPE
jgi:hypothetical protein